LAQGKSKQDYQCAVAYLSTQVRCDLHHEGEAVIVSVTKSQETNPGKSGAVLDSPIEHWMSWFWLSYLHSECRSDQTAINYHEEGGESIYAAPCP
jgi:hypothetical protein